MKVFGKWRALMPLAVLTLGVSVLAACGEQTYEIKFLNWDGSELSAISVREDGAVTYDGAAPVRAGDAQYSYTFSGWRDENGMVYTELPSATESMTYTAVYNSAINEYAVRFLLDDTVLSSKIYSYGSRVFYEGETPEKAATSQYNFTFAGWTDGDSRYSVGDALPDVTGAVDYTALFDETVRRYSIEWNAEGATSQSEFAYGDTAVYTGSAPVKEGNRQYTYTFVGWAAEPNGTVLTSAEMIVTGETTYYAVFTSDLNKYKVIFQNEDGTQLSSEMLPYGSAVEYRGTPVKEGDAQYSYTFAGWTDGDTVYAPEDALPNVTEDCVWEAVYTSSLNAYQVSWSVDGTLFKDTYYYGDTPAFDGNTSKPNDDYSYIFQGWATSKDGEVLLQLPAVTGDATYYAVYEQTDLAWKVTWMIDDLVIDSSVLDGHTPVYDGSEPVKEGDAQYSYTFAGWTTEQGSEEVVDLDSQMITEDVVYYAVFTQTINQYAITFVIEGISGEPVLVEYGAIPEYDGEAPSKAGDVQYSYVFAGWAYSAEGTVLSQLPAVTGPATYFAVFDRTLKEYTITIEYYSGLTEDTPLSERTKSVKLTYGTEYGKDETLSGAYTQDSVKYVPDRYWFTGVVTGDETLKVHYTAADVWDGSVATEFAGGTGTKQDPYLIATGAQLAFLAQEANANNTTYSGNVYYKLVSSIDLNGLPWTPIGYLGTTAYRWFNKGGEFDGGGYTVCGLYFNNTQSATLGRCIGLFGAVQGSIKNLIVEGQLSANNRIGGIAYYIHTGTISDCVSYVGINAVSGSTLVGGIAGACSNNGSVVDCINYGTVSGSGSVGGIVGSNTSSGTTITGNINYGTVVGTANSIGGIIGITSASGTTISGNVNYGPVTGVQAVGGITGSSSNCTISDCVNYGAVIGDNRLGGISGSTTTVTVTGCVNYGSVTMAEDCDGTGYGGIVGWTTTNSVITDCHNHAAVNGYSNVGGISGYLGKGSSVAREGEESCTNDGAIGGGSYTGDLVGYDANG